MHQSRVYSIAFRILGDCGAAEEAAQDVFLSL
ncbi:MAG: sigma factor [Acidobacteriaceae bacterium]